MVVFMCVHRNRNKKKPTAAYNTHITRENKTQNEETNKNYGIAMEKDAFISFKRLL